MITHYEVHSLLQEEIPQLVSKDYPLDVSMEIYASINRFAEYTSNALSKHEYMKAKKCFAIAEKLYNNGDVIVRFLIENSFVYHFSSHKPENRSDNVILKSVVPKTLYSIYVKQLTENHN